MYRGARVGRAGRIFTMYKFRTLRPDAETRLGPYLGDELTRLTAAEVTRVGRVLRFTHFDELPQLWNVLRGDMSVVGPRPIRPAFFEELCEEIPQYWQRLVVEPGHHRLRPAARDARDLRGPRSSRTTSSTSPTARCACTCGSASRPRGASCELRSRRAGSPRSQRPLAMCGICGLVVARRGRRRPRRRRGDERHARPPRPRQRRRRSPRDRSRLRCGGCRSSTWPAATSRSATRTAACR